ncbi:MAG: AEC family transporter [Candidatus Omnitrophica bacterium]|nr:AEC family transporter [Candidatus Omnitrophota bacterium]MBU4488161.1 AEC family transporter [Candidatus Omnitrophota bacterium]MCG2704707.1 AEC family transporter [Candidatus Omnitrophota bacterium]
MFSQVLSKVSVLFVFLIIGAIARYKGLLNEEFNKSLAKLVLMITLPVLYFYSLATQFTLELFKTIWPLPVFAVCFVLLAYLLAKFFSRFVELGPKERATFIYLSTFTNCGFLAIPIANMLYGTEGVMRVVFFNIGFNILYWTLGVWTLRASNDTIPSENNGMKSSLKNLVNSGTIGLLCGIIVGALAIKLPPFIMDASSMLGAATIPIALLVVGSIMGKGNIREIYAQKGALSLIVLCKLVIMPAFAIFITGFFGSLDPLTRAIIILQAAMPSASTTPIFTTRFGGDSKLASIGVFVTTISSIITIPIIMSLI